jgi:hypothetical protein
MLSEDADDISALIMTVQLGSVTNQQQSSQRAGT